MADYPEDEDDMPPEDQYARPAPTGALDAMLRRDVAGGVEGSETAMTVMQEQAQWELALDGMEPEQGEEKTEPRRTNLAGVRMHEKRMRFLAAIRQSANIRLACRAAGVARTCVYEWRDKDPLFKAAWDEAVEEFYDMADARGKQLAIEGVDVPVFQGGAIVGHRREVSERLLLRLLEKGRPDTWAGRTEQNVRISGSVSTGPDALVTEEARKALHARVLKLSPLLMARQSALLKGQAPAPFVAPAQGDGVNSP